MPSKTFLNLPKEKRDKIQLAAMKEFSSVSFEKVSINRIIKQAEISRGSFYMYFEDIYDLAIYLVEDTKKHIINQVLNREVIKEGQLDLILLDLNDLIYEYYNQKENLNFFRNFMIYFQGMPEEKINSIRGVMKKGNEFSLLTRMLDKSQFKDQSDENIRNISQLAFILFRNVILQTIVNKLSKEESQKLLKNSLEILKHGYGGCKDA